MQSTLTFYGGAGSVTGSNFMLDTGQQKLLIDCGFQQGMREEDNYKPFAYEPGGCSHLFISHAHLDHVGRIPFLVKSGFAGKIISTTATRALAEFIMRDALGLMVRAQEHGGQAPLYSEQDIDAALGLWEPRGLHEPLELAGGMTHEFYDAGHILGSAMSRFERGGKSLVVTGDLGGGTLLIPAFSTERTQDLIYEIRSLMTSKKIPSVPVFLDSPLAEKITQSFYSYPEYFAPVLSARIKAGEKLFEFAQMRFARDTQESRAIQHVQGPKIILAGSGMSNGGRVLSHERYVLPDEKSTLLIVGYQAAGTIGRRLLEGAKGPNA